MISFYPGPSKIYPEVASIMNQAVSEGILSVNHRSAEFVELSIKCLSLLKEKLNIPEDYCIFFVSSATECWEIIAQSLILDRSFHLFNGAFGEKWYEYTKRIRPGASAYQFTLDEIPSNDISIPPSSELICLTHNETSNGTKIEDNFIRQLRDEHPEKLIAVDATSSMAGIEIDFSAADIWLASVQKCFGLPAGLGLLICSPSTMGRALSLGESNHYNSLLFLNEMMAKSQTTYTPNVLGIYLLRHILEKRREIREISSMITERAKRWYQFFEENTKYDLLIKNKSIRSQTVITVKASKDDVTQIKSEAKKQGIVLGNGYGPWAETTFRIANFPAHTEQEIEKLKKFLTDFGN